MKKHLILKLNTELFRASGILTLILFLLETLKEGYVSFYLNPVIVLVIFLVSGVVWLFDKNEPDSTFTLSER
ncbi:hypothetical protein CL632_01450 [bacterium]|jgi:hypothetical protein|nr:hypothetical protein [bacterium]|tara:strand:- start:267 stop:482 length:216 start_codon:yes stop_codon:yes gene_type:complete